MSEPFKINTNQRKTKVCFYLNWLVDLWMSAVSPGGTAIQQLNSLSIPIKFINYWWNLMEWREWVCWLQPPQPTIHQTAQLSCCLIGLVACLLPSLRCNSCRRPSAPQLRRIQWAVAGFSYLFFCFLFFFFSSFARHFVLGGKERKRRKVKFFYLCCLSGAPGRPALPAP